MQCASREGSLLRFQHKGRGFACNWIGYTATDRVKLVACACDVVVNARCRGRIGESYISAGKGRRVRKSLRAGDRS